MLTKYVLLLKTEQNEENESVLIDCTLFKVTGESDEAIAETLKTRLASLNLGYAYSFKFYSNPPELPADSTSLLF